MSKETPNQRGSEREELALHVAVELDGVEEAILLDLSDGGAKFMTSKALEPGQSLLCLVRSSDQIPRDISLLFKVAWCRPGVRLGYFDVGGRIAVKEESMKDSLKQLVAKLSMRSYH